MTQPTSHYEVLAVSRSYHDAIEIFSHHFLKMVSVALFPNLITFLLYLALRTSFVATLVSLENLPALLKNPWTVGNIHIGVTLLALLGIFITQVIGAAAVTVLVIHHEKLTLMETFEKAVKFFWRFILLGLALFGISIAATFIGFLVVTAVGIILGRFSLNLMTSAFDWLTLIPVLLTALASTLFIFSGFVLVDKDAKTGVALKRSFQLIRGRIWPIALRIILLYIVLTVVALILQLIPFVGAIIGLVILSPFSFLYLSVLYSHLSGK